MGQVWQRVAEDDARQVGARRADFLVPGSRLHQEDHWVAAALWQGARL